MVQTANPNIILQGMQVQSANSANAIREQTANVRETTARKRDEENALGALTVNADGSPAEGARESLAKLAVSNPMAAQITQSVIQSQSQEQAQQYRAMLVEGAKETIRARELTGSAREAYIQGQIAESVPGSPDEAEWLELRNQTPEQQDIALSQAQRDFELALTPIEDLLKKPEGFTLSEGQARFTADGQEIVKLEKAEQTGRNRETFKLGATIAVDDGNGGKKLVAGVLNSNTGEFTAEEAGVKGAFVSRTTGETGDQTTDRAIREAGGKTAASEEAERGAIAGKVGAKGSAERIQANIATGIDAASQLPTILRSIELLNSVETGGFEGASIRARTLFGVTSADEAELSAGLGKAVVSQLRETFGAAFTAAEGQELKRIEAGIGKSTEGNRRQLNNLRQFIEKKAKRGMDDAASIGDFRAAQQIQESLNFRLKQDEPGKTLTFDAQGNMIQ